MQKQPLLQSELRESLSMNEEDQIDLEFGHWLKDQRVRVGLSLDDAAEKVMISSSRLKSLEMGFAEKGITKTEAERLSQIYKVQLDDVLKRASG
jgi:ribosome-binding protein aMBF1 (putative translation factor)